MGRDSENTSSSRELLASKKTLGEILIVAIQFEKTELVVSGQLKQNQHLCHLGIQFNTKGCEIRVDKENSTKNHHWPRITYTNFISRYYDIY